MTFLKSLALGLSGFFLFISVFFSVLFTTINSTILNPGFIISEYENLDIAVMAQTCLKDLDLKIEQRYIDALDNTIAQEKPWIDQQIKNCVYASYDYLSGTTDQLSFYIPLSEIEENLSENIIAAFLQSPPPEFLELSSQQKELYLSKLKQQIIETIPANLRFEINETTIGNDSMKALQNIREAISDFRTAFIFLICLIILFVLLIVFIERKIQGTLRILGIILLITGAFGIASYFILKQVINLIVASNEFLLQFNSFLPVLINDLISPLGIYYLIVLLAGGVCLLTSILFRREKVSVSF